MKAVRWLAIMLVAASTAVAAPLEKGANVKVEIVPPQARPGQTVVFRLTMELLDGRHTYPTKQPHEDAVRTKFKFPSDGDLIFVGDIVDPPSVSRVELGVPTQEIEGTAVWELTAVVSPRAQPGRKRVDIHKGTKLQACNDRGCIPVEVPVTEFTVLDGAAQPVDPKYKDAVEQFLSAAPPTPDPPTPAADPRGANAAKPDAPPAAGRPVAPPAASLTDHVANLEKIKEQLPKHTEERKTLLNFILTAVFWGLVSLVTPCVFPMIPITVSFFLKQSAKEHHRPVRMASIYCLTIVVVLGLAALLLLNVFYYLSRHWITNATIGAIFIVFALSLFGMYELTLPTSVANFTSAREGRGGTIGTVFMALTFTVISFTCVAPFLGGFAGLVGSKQYHWTELTLGAFAYSTTFAAPFFVLALFPSMIKKLPKSGSWLNSVKVVMGFLELAAAFKFFRTAELRLLDTGAVYFTYDLVMGVWVALAVACGLYLLNVYRFSHDTPGEHVGVGRALLALTFFGLAFYIAPAMFKQPSGDSQRPRGVAFAWIDSFLLPEPRIATAGDDSELHWSVNLKGTIDEARKELARTGRRQFIFIDYTGVTCTNCQINERNVFPRDDVRKLFREYWLVQQYTDEVRPEFYPAPVDKERREQEAEANLSFQNDRFGDIQLPLYVIIEVFPDKLTLRGKYDEGKINEVSKFLEFLRKSKE